MIRVRWALLGMVGAGAALLGAGIPAFAQNAVPPRPALPVEENFVPAPSAVPVPPSAPAGVREIPPALPPVQELTPAHPAAGAPDDTNIPAAPAVDPLSAPVASPPTPAAAPATAPADPTPPATDPTMAGNETRREPPPPPMANPPTLEEVERLFDATTTPSGQKGIPTLADPAQTPASSLVTVHRAGGPNDRSARIAAASRAMDLERFEAALGFYEELLIEDPSDTRVMLGRAIALHKLDRSDAALVAYEEILEREPGNKTALINLTGLLQDRYPAIALQRLTALAQRYPTNAQILGQLGVLYGRTGDVDNAKQFLGRAMALDPANPQHVYNMAVLADDGNAVDEAIDLYEQALALDATGDGSSTLDRAAVYDRLFDLRRR